MTRPLRLRVRSAGADGSDEPRTILRPDWDAARTAVIICDMWDAHHCVTAARRVAEMAPRVNEVAAGLREQGALIIHAPSGCVDFWTLSRDTSGWGSIPRRRSCWKRGSCA